MVTSWGPQIRKADPLTFSTNSWQRRGGEGRGGNIPHATSSVQVLVCVCYDRGYRGYFLVTRVYCDRCLSKTGDVHHGVSVTLLSSLLS